MIGPRLAFVAYPSRDPQLQGIMRSAIQKANTAQGPVQFDSWEFNDIPGTPLISPILDKIDVSGFIVADITFLNPNVVYEVGFAIGKRKHMFQYD